MGDAEQAIARMGELAKALSRALDADVSPKRSAEYRELVGALEEGAVQVAWVPPLLAACPVRDGTIVPIAVAVRSGATSYSAGLISRADSPVRCATDLRSVRAAWVDRQSASGYVAIRQALRATGLHLREAFGEEVFAKSHSEVARLVAEGSVDVGATYFSWAPDGSSIERAGWMGLPGIDPEGFRLVAEAGPIPSDMFAVHSGMDKHLVAALESALVDGRPRGARRPARQLTQADGFVRPTREHLAMLDALASTQEPHSSVFPRAE